jgi:hypothetical protein
MIITNFVPCSIGKSALMAQPGLHIDLKLAALGPGTACRSAVGRLTHPASYALIHAIKGITSFGRPDAVSRPYKKIFPGAGTQVVLAPPKALIWNSPFEMTSPCERHNYA